MVFKGLVKWERIAFTLLIAFAVVVLAATFHSASDPLRIAIWTHVAQHLSIFGSGIGSATNIYMFTPNELFHLEHAHNDYLNLLYEYGLGALPLFALALVLVEQTDAYAWSALICCLILSSFFWTLEAPPTAFALAVVAGHIAGSSRVAWDHFLVRRPRLVPSHASRG